MKKSVKRIAATAAAAMMMLSGSSIGASAASPYTLKRYSENGSNGYISTSMFTYKYNNSYKRSVQCATTCKKNGSWYMYVSATLKDKNMNDLSTDGKSLGNMTTGSSLTAIATKTSSSIKYAYNYSYLRTTANASSKDFTIMINAF